MARERGYFEDKNQPKTRPGEDAHGQSFGELMHDIDATDAGYSHGGFVGLRHDPPGFSGVGMAARKELLRQAEYRPPGHPRDRSGVGRIAKRLGVRREQLNACIKDAGLAAPPVKGSCRVYTKQQVDQIVGACTSNHTLGA